MNIPTHVKDSHNKVTMRNEVLYADDREDVRKTALRRLERDGRKIIRKIPGQKRGGEKWKRRSITNCMGTYKDKDERNQAQRGKIYWTCAHDHNDNNCAKDNVKD